MNRAPAFQLPEAVSGTTWPAAGYDEPWNGWATPVVERTVLAQLVTELGEEAEWDGDRCYLDGSELCPDEGGRYHLRTLGWTFTTA